jgi:integrase
MQKMVDAIDESIAVGTFNYRQFFPLARMPRSSNGTPASAKAVSGTNSAAVKPTPLFKDFADIWFGEKEIEWRTSHKKTVRDDIDKRLIPRFGDMMVGNITKADILAFRADLAKAPARTRPTCCPTHGSIRY